MNKVKRAKSTVTALGKQCNPSRGPSKQQKGPFQLKRTKMGYWVSVCLFFNFSINPN